MADATTVKVSKTLRDSLKEIQKALRDADPSVAMFSERARPGCRWSMEDVIWLGVTLIASHRQAVERLAATVDDRVEQAAERATNAAMDWAAQAVASVMALDRAKYAGWQDPIGTAVATIDGSRSLLVFEHAGGRRWEAIPLDLVARMVSEAFASRSEETDAASAAVIERVLKAAGGELGEPPATVDWSDVFGSQSRLDA